MLGSELHVLCATGGSAAQRAAFAQVEAEAAAACGGSVLVLCASSAAAQAMGVRVPRGVSVSTPLSTAEELLRRKRERPVRVLGAVDERVLFEDMRVTQIRQSRLKNLMRFLERGFANMDDDDDTWIETGEERLVYETLVETLCFSGGVLASQAAGRAVRLLRSVDNMRRFTRFDVVVACDYHLMSRASQRLACALATDRLVVVAGRGAEHAAEDAYPNFAGVSELSRAFSQVEMIDMRESDGERVLDISAELFGDVVDEISYIAAMADEVCSAGADTSLGASSGERPTKMLVISASAAWRGACARMLRRRGVSVRLEDDARDVPDDLRRPSGGVERAVLARLREDARDPLAWRTWCALGDYLGCGAAVRRLREATRSSSLDLARALDLLSRDELAGACSDDPAFAKLISRYREGLALLSDDDESDADAGFGAEAAVVVCSPRAAHGYHAKKVVVGACVEGVLSCARETCELVLMRAKEVADERIVGTSFSRCGESAATSMGVEVVRIGLHEGVKVCKTKPDRLWSMLRSKGDGRS